MTKKLNTIKIKGKDYVMVKDRVIDFNENYPEGSITSEIVKNDDKSVVVKAIVWPDSKNILRRFVGHSEAYREGNMGSVPVEVAETSAIGRALGMMGIGIVEGIASADEIVKANYEGKTNSRLATQKQKDYLQKMLQNKKLNLLTDEELEKLTMDEASKLIDKHGFKPNFRAYPDRDNDNQDSNFEAGGEGKTIINY